MPLLDFKIDGFFCAALDATRAVLFTIAVRQLICIAILGFFEGGGILLLNVICQMTQT